MRDKSIDKISWAILCGILQHDTSVLLYAFSFGNTTKENAHHRNILKIYKKEVFIISASFSPQLPFSLFFSVQ